jgi:hypothetical protein
MAHAKECHCYDCMIEHIERQIRELFKLVHHIFELLGKTQHGFSIQQLFEGENMAITGIVVGATGVFQETPTPPGAVIPPGTKPVWTTSDTVNTALTPSADGTQVSVAVLATTTITTFNLSVSNQDGSFLTTVAVPVLPAIVKQTGFVINQLS